jgi:hypothetical protein
MEKKYSGKFKQSRNCIINGINQLDQLLPFKIGRPSHLRVLKGACAYLKKNKHFSKLKGSIKYEDLIFSQQTSYLKDV